jgi:Fic-DOC domain mobile mystery protein B
MFRDQRETDAATPLDDDEAAALIPTHIGTRAALNAWEQANIAAGTTWLRGRRRRGTVLNQDVLKEVHRRMFAATWTWAGMYRTTGKNIGVPAGDIPRCVHELLEDVKFWIAHATYDATEIGIRFHHRLVQIHPFPNGNGRQARLMTDELVRELGAEPFTWGSGSIDDEGAVRARYIEALRAADRGNLVPLAAFVRS